MYLSIYIILVQNTQHVAQKSIMKKIPQEQNTHEINLRMN